MNAEKLEKLARDADDLAARCSQRGDTEGSFYARGMRDGYRIAAAFWSSCDDPTHDPSRIR